MVVKRILNPSKKNHVEGNIFHLIFLGSDAVLYDSLWDEPIIYGPKTLVRTAITDNKKLPAYLPKELKSITLFVYRIQANGKIKRMGDPITGNPIDITVPNY